MLNNNHEGVTSGCKKLENMETIKFDKRLSETRFMENLDFSKPFKIMVDAPTGSGKTYYIVDYLKENDVPFVFLADTLLLMRQISSTYNVNLYSASDKDNYDSEQLITVYNHIDKFWKDKVVVVDEFHSLITDYGFKKEVVDKMLTFIGESKQVIMLSGTSLVSKDPVYKEFKALKFEYNDPIKAILNIHNIPASENSLEYAVKLAIDSKERGKVPVISLLNTSDKMQELQELLIVNGFNSIGLINSITKEDNELDLDCSHYSELVNNSTILADCIITTYVQGYNINNENCSLIIVPTNTKHSYVSIVQMMARFRNIKELDANLITKETVLEPNDDGRFFIPKPWLDFNKMYNVTEESLVSNVLSYISDLKNEYATNRAIKYFLKLSPANGQYVDNDLHINYQMISKDVISKISDLMYIHPVTANTVLSQFNINIEVKNILNSEIMKPKEFNKLDYKIVVDTFFNYLEVGKFYDTNMGYKVKEHYDKLKEFRLLDREIKPILQETFGDKKAFNKVISSLEFRLSEDSSIRRIRKDLFSEFKVNQWYSTAVIFKKVSTIISDNGGECNSKSKATEILNFLFETESTLKRADGIVIRGVTIKSAK